jgi:hypothetical protein
MAENTHRDDSGAQLIPVLVCTIFVHEVTSLGFGNDYHDRSEAILEDDQRVSFAEITGDEQGTETV